MYRGFSTALVIPAYNEEEAIGAVISAVDRKVVDRVIVVDNGSDDATRTRAEEAGAEVVGEPRRGYGTACLAGIRAAPDSQILIFLDGDGSDDPAEISELLRALFDRDADMVIGSRTLGQAEPGSLSVVQRFGNLLTCSLVRLLWGVLYTDLGPFRAIRRPALEQLKMADPDFGWTIEMQVKTAQHKLRAIEVPVRYRRRQAGVSKISGSIRGSYMAGKRILGYVVLAKLHEIADQWLPR